MGNDAIVTIQFLTVVLTIVGFAVTAQRQKELLDNQRGIEKYRFAVERKVKLLEEFSNLVSRRVKDIFVTNTIRLVLPSFKPSEKKIWKKELETLNYESMKDRILNGYYVSMCRAWDGMLNLNLLTAYIHFLEVGMEAQKCDTEEKLLEVFGKIDDAADILQTKIEEAIVNVSTNF